MQFRLKFISGAFLAARKVVMRIKFRCQTFNVLFKFESNLLFDPPQYNKTTLITPDSTLRGWFEPPRREIESTPRIPRRIRRVVVSATKRSYFVLIRTTPIAHMETLYNIIPRLWRDAIHNHNKRNDPSFEPASLVPRPFGVLPYWSDTQKNKVWFE